MPPRNEMPESRDKIEKTPAEITPEQLQRAFSQRLMEGEHLDPLNKKNGLFRSPDGRILRIPEIREFYAKTLQEDCGFNNTSAWHVIKFQLQPLFDELSSFRKNREGNTDVSKNLAEAMFDIAKDPTSYGIDLESQDTPRHLVRVNDDERLALLRDEESVADPLYVNGQIPMPKALGDSLRRIFEKIYPENDPTTKRTIMLLKERCVLQLVRELIEVEKKKVSSKDEARNKRNQREKVINKMTHFMRDALSPEKISLYVEGIKTGQVSENLVQFASLTRRPSYEMIENADGDRERWENTQNFYKHLSEKYTEEEKTQLVLQFDRDDTDFFRDEAGPKAVTHIYYDILAVMKQRGATEEQLNTTFLPYIKEMVQSLIEVKNALDEEYKRGSERKQSEIQRLKSLLSQTQKSFLKKGKEYIENIDFLSMLSASTSEDSESVLRGVQEGSSESLEDDFAFVCEDFSDLGVRQDSFDNFKLNFESILDPLRQLAIANVLSNDDSFIKIRDEFSQNLSDFEGRLKIATFTREEAVVDSKKIIDLFTSLRDLYENYEESNDTLRTEEK